MTQRIDAHHHFWGYNPEEYGWISDDLCLLRRDFLPAELRTQIQMATIDGVVSVQARQSLQETGWLLALTEKYSFLSGVVGWLPIAADDFLAHLTRFASHPKLKGLRHVIQDEPDDNYMLRADFNRGIAALQGTSLVYDILVFAKHLPQAIQFVDLHPNQIFILDHMAKPQIRLGVLDPWRKHIRELAKRENVYCKISGMVTEANWQTWSQPDLQPYFDVVLNAFEANRLMVGSDWPVCLLASGYARWFETVHSLISKLSRSEQQQILGETAREVYHLEDPPRQQG